MTNGKESGNQCLDNGCHGACCYNVRFRNVTPDQLDVLAPEGVRRIYVTSEEMPLIIASVAQEITQKGPTRVTPKVYVAPDRGKTTSQVYLAGPCPNLKGSQCSEYRRRPPQCDLFAFGGAACGDTRRTHGLSPIIARTIGRRPN